MSVSRLTIPAILVGIALGLCPIAKGQAEQVQVQSLAIHYQNIDSYFTMVVRGTTGEDVTYRGWGTYQLVDLYFCDPCKIPNTFASNGFQSSPFLSFQWASPEKYVRIYVPSATSPPFIVDPRIRWRPQTVVRTVPTDIQGRIEILDQVGNLLAYDNDLSLHGTSSTELGVLTDIAPGRVLDFHNLNIALAR